MAWNKEFRLPNVDEVPVWEVKVAGYGTIVVECEKVNRAGGEVQKVLIQAGVNPGLIDGMERSTRTREYLNNLPSFHGEK